jgi:cellulose synthase/poly-beta-1,6-N-acetylglucosamine synthase-like glycosyltransferase
MSGDDDAEAGEGLPRGEYFVDGLGEARSFFDASTAPSDFARPSSPIGELAVAAGMIHDEAMQRLLGLQRQWGTRLGDIMVSTGGVKPDDVARLVGTQSGLRYVDLKTEPADPTLSNAVDLDFYIAHRCLPWRWIDRETVYVAADPERARVAIGEREGRACAVLVASSRDIDRALQGRFHIALNERARFDLSKKTPESSAHRRMNSPQAWTLAIFAVLTGLSFWQAPAYTTIVVNLVLGLCFLAIAGLRCLSIFVGLFGARTADELAYERGVPAPDTDLPIYTVLVPLFREAAVLPLLADALRKLDYPASKLDIKLVFEELDVETIEAAKALDLPGNFEFICVPHSLPLTKPKACNFALPFARGEFLVVYDAEDAPEPDQLKRAVAAFNLGDEKLACVQAQLNYYNVFENWLTRQFALEYAAFFDLLLPTLAKLGLPIPLGGTSTHFRTALLRAAGAWDPFNVTEDADLGMRFAMLGLRTGIIRSTTHEEANCRIDNWLRQRSRWIKGWVQTYFVRMRHPIQLYRALGLKGFLGFQIVIGGFSLSSIVHPLFYLSTIMAIIFTQRWPGAGMHLNPSEGVTIALFNMLVLVTGYSITVVAGMTAAAGRGLQPLILSALMMPAYWLLISLGAYRAVYQFASRPFYWEKTHHGISSLTVAHLARLKSSRTDAGELR